MPVSAESYPRNSRFELRTDRCGPGELTVVSVDGREALNQPFTFDVIFASTLPKEELENRVADLPATVTTGSADRPGSRIVSGVAIDFGPAPATDPARRSGLQEFVVSIVPELARLRSRSQRRVFQNKYPIDVALAILAANGLDADVRIREEDYALLSVELQGQNESDLAFFQRVLGSAAIFYYFRHPFVWDSSTSKSSARTTLVLADKARSTERLGATSPSSPAYLRVSTAPGGDQRPECISHWGFRRRPCPTQFTLGNCKVRETPSSALWRADADEEPVSVTCSVDAAGEVFFSAGPGDPYETSGRSRPNLHMPQADYCRNVAPYGMSLATAYAMARRALLQLRRDDCTFNGKSLCHELAPGYRFTLAGERDKAETQEYLVTSVRSRGQNGGATPDPAEGPDYHCTFRCVLASVDPLPERPARVTSHAPEPVTVLGPKKGEVYQDAIGRILVRFRWAEANVSSHGDNDEGICWARWVEPFARPAFGGTTVPRVGDLMLLEFAADGEPLAVWPRQ
jgi:type VI secretion system secreted protein VgrG